MRSTPPDDIAEETPEPVNASPGTWLITGDGNNRAKIRKQVSELPRKVRLSQAAKMQHQRDISHLRLHPLWCTDSTQRNALRRIRQARA